ncbi:hypothetical protein MES5069_1270014 [Mesorhizobium escarrei]|uniref:Uncharacterized protein n=1 Tax=Mesorhizobium escarrei TaxID=666018 RepID=A0ABM9DH54_9HYPH|nr:hypothetical protein MES5069_1270014 [Mesorhizobium escarrei]
MALYGHLPHLGGDRPSPLISPIANKKGAGVGVPWNDQRRAIAQ